MLTGLTSRRGLAQWAHQRVRKLPYKQISARLGFLFHIKPPTPLHMALLLLLECQTASGGELSLRAQMAGNCMENGIWDYNGDSSAGWVFSSKHFMSHCMFSVNGRSSTSRRPPVSCDPSGRSLERCILHTPGFIHKFSSLNKHRCEGELTCSSMKNSASTQQLAVIVRSGITGLVVWVKQV